MGNRQELTTVQLSKEHKRRLDVIAAVNHRKAPNQIEHWIDESWKKIDPEIKDAFVGEKLSEGAPKA